MALSSTTADELETVVATLLRSDNQRYTSARRALVAVLATLDRPVTMAELLDRSAGLAQSSAYRNLAVLERAGVVHRIVTNDEFARFELAENLTEHHHHLICSACGRVDDFTIPGALEATLDAAFARVASEHGFAVEHHTLDLVGTCRTCR